MRNYSLKRSVLTTNLWRFVLNQWYQYNTLLPTYIHFSLLRKYKCYQTRVVYFSKLSWSKVTLTFRFRKHKSKSTHLKEFIDSKFTINHINHSTYTFRVEWVICTYVRSSSSTVLLFRNVWQNDILPAHTFYSDNSNVSTLNFFLFLIFGKWTSYYHVPSTDRPVFGGMGRAGRAQTGGGRRRRRRRFSENVGRPRPAEEHRRNGRPVSPAGGNGLTSAGRPLLGSEQRTRRTAAGRPSDPQKHDGRRRRRAQTRRATRARHVPPRLAPCPYENTITIIIIIIIWHRRN